MPQVPPRYRSVKHVHKTLHLHTSTISAATACSFPGIWTESAVSACWWEIRVSGGCSFGLPLRPRLSESWRAVPDTLNHSLVKVWLSRCRRLAPKSVLLSSPLRGQSITLKLDREAVSRYQGKIFRDVRLKLTAYMRRYGSLLEACMSPSEAMFMICLIIRQEMARNFFESARLSTVCSLCRLWL